MELQLNAKKMQVSPSKCQTRFSKDCLINVDESLNFPGTIRPKMVRLTAEYIERKCSQDQLQKSLTRQLKKSDLCGLTHLRMNNKFITSIGNLALYKNVRVIYLHNNSISKIENLHFASDLTHLYLQHNAIGKIENLNGLSNLRTLYLGYNCISVLEGFENSRNLTVLHLENQEIHEPLCFDPRSITALSGCLKVLNISGNKIRSLRGIENLRALEALDVRDNYIDDIEDLTECINELRQLRELQLENNPVTSCHRYKENLIANNDSIQIINGKPITDVCRSFMKGFKREKHLRLTRKSSKADYETDIADSLNLPPALKRSISRALFQQAPTKFNVTISSSLVEVAPRAFPPWRIAPNASGMRGSHIMPRPFWGNASKKKSARVLQSFITSKPIVLPPI